GVTILQLFAFMSESLLYRANQVPERSRRKFLRLLGVGLQPATPAEGLVTFSNPKGPLAVRLLPPDVELLAGQVPFRTLSGMDVLPVEGKPYLKARPALSAVEAAQTDALYRQLYASVLAETDTPAYYETRPFQTPGNGAALPVLDLNGERPGDPVDGTLWFALLARKADEVEAAREALAGKVLTLGVVPALVEEERVLLPGAASADAAAPAAFEYSLPNVAGGGGARYRVLDARPRANLLIEPGVVELPLPASADALTTWRVEDLEPLDPGVGDYPPSLEDAADADRLITWVRIRVAAAAEAAGRQLAARLSWIGLNATRVTQRARVAAEFVGQGTGEPDQSFTLVNTPVLPESVVLAVNGELWARTDDLAVAAPEVPRPRLLPGAIEQPVSLADARVYTVDRETGVVRFGDGLRGARPPAGSVVLASYDYGGGLQGMVGPAAITRGPSLPSGVKVSNPVATWGGDEAETVAEAERRVPTYIKHRSRLVAKEDFEEITRQTPGVEIGRVEILPLVHPNAPDVPARGVVTVLVIPRFDPVQPDAPTPDRLFLDAVCAHLNPRRLLTTELHVRGPVYVGLYLSVGIDVMPGADVAPVREAVRAQLTAFLSPLFGGFEGTGWPLGRSVDAQELLVVAARVSGVSRVGGVLLAEGDAAAATTVPITGLELPRLVGLSVSVGDPLPLDDLRGTSVPSGPGTGLSIVPIPTVPAEC
ncbi:MAG TPA: putative baseplate assembly protein, partial [Rhodothermales bacterium]|nr:putative baseplate assembly protein [Rhodothermales bacterium]